MVDLKTGRELTQKDAFTYLRRYKKDFESLNPQNQLLFSSNRFCGNGLADGFNKHHLEVGIHGIDIESNEPVHMLDFVSCLVAVNHEIRHSKQFFELMHGSDEESLAFAYDYKISDNSLSFYRMNYSDNPREIDAELYGMMNAHGFLTEHFGEKNADRLICAYQNFKSRYGRTFIKPEKGRNYDSFEDIVIDMESKLESSIHSKKKFPLFGVLNKNDALAVMFKKNSNDLKRFRKIDDGLLQLKFCATLVRERVGLSDDDALSVCVLDSIDVKKEIECHVHPKHCFEEFLNQDEEQDDDDDEYY